MVCAVALIAPKTLANVASVLRTAECFGADLVLYTGRRYHHDVMDVFGSWARVPLVHTDDIRSQVPHSHVPVAIEIVGENTLPKFDHPRNALYVFGPEDGTLGREQLSWCRNVIRVPTRKCLNLAVCVGVVLYDRNAKACVV